MFCACAMQQLSSLISGRKSTFEKRKIKWIMKTVPEESVTTVKMKSPIPGTNGVVNATWLITVLPLSDRQQDWSSYLNSMSYYASCNVDYQSEPGLLHLLNLCVWYTLMLYFVWYKQCLFFFLHPILNLILVIFIHVF